MLVQLNVTGSAHTEGVEVAEHDTVGVLRSLCASQLAWHDTAVLRYLGEELCEDTTTLQELGMVEDAVIDVDIPMQVQALKKLEGMGHTRIDYFTCSQAVAKRDYALVELMLATKLVAPDVKYGFVNCDIELFDILIEAGLDLTKSDDLYRSAVCLACERNDLPLCEYLVAKGAPVPLILTPEKSGDSYNHYPHTTPLIEAAKHHNTTMFEFLLARGADAGQRSRFTNPLTAAIIASADVGHAHGAAVGAHACECCTPERRRFKTLQFCEYLLSKGVPPDVTQGIPPLLCAAELGRQDIAKLLISHNADVSTLSYDHRTALYGAISGNHATLCTFLLEGGAENGSIPSFNGKGNTPLVEAIVSGKWDCAEALVVHGVSLGVKENKQNVLLLAVKSLHAGLVKILLETGRCADQVATVDEDGRSLLMISGYHGEVDTVTALLEHGCDVNVQDPYGYTALMFAAEYGEEEVCSHLIRAGAKIAAVDSLGRSAVFLAERRRHVQLARYLKETELAQAQ